MNPFYNVHNMKARYFILMPVCALESRANVQPNAPMQGISPYASIPYPINATQTQVDRPQGVTGFVSASLFASTSTFFLRP